MIFLQSKENKLYFRARTRTYFPIYWSAIIYYVSKNLIYNPLKVNQYAIR
jgi:hypothetical protein